MSRKAGWMLIGLVAGWAGSAQGQPAFQVFGGSSPAAVFLSASTTGGGLAQGEVLHARVNHSEATHSIAVVGISSPQAGWGSGGSFQGGYEGLRGVAGLPGLGPRFGLLGYGWNGDRDNFGVWASARAPDESGKLAFGVYGVADCIDDGTNCVRTAVYADGDLVVTGDTLAPSDLRFKESLAPLGQALGKLLELEVVSYEHVRTEEVAHMNLPEGPQVGFVAQQVAEVLPELVTEAVHPGARNPLDRTLEDEPIRYQALKTIDLIPYLVRAVQEQQAEIEALRAQLLPLRNRLAELEPGAGAGEARVPAAF